MWKLSIPISLRKPYFANLNSEISTMLILSYPFIYSMIFYIMIKESCLDYQTLTWQDYTFLRIPSLKKLNGKWYNCLKTPWTLWRTRCWYSWFGAQLFLSVPLVCNQKYPLSVWSVRMYWHVGSPPKKTGWEFFQSYIMLQNISIIAISLEP